LAWAGQAHCNEDEGDGKRQGEKELPVVSSHVSYGHRNQLRVAGQVRGTPVGLWRGEKRSR
jgi:hypothetical protein